MENMTQEQMLEKLAALTAENERLKAAKIRPITCKVSAEKKCLSVYGIGRFPVTLYRGQWERLLGEAEKIKAFIVEHSGELAVKE